MKVILTKWGKFTSPKFRLENLHIECVIKRKLDTKLRRWNFLETRCNEFDKRILGLGL
jgi:hypothetical protein